MGKSVFLIFLVFIARISFGSTTGIIILLVISLILIFGLLSATKKGKNYNY